MTNIETSRLSLTLNHPAWFVYRISDEVFACVRGEGWFQGERLDGIPLAKHLYSCFANNEQLHKIIKKVLFGSFSFILGDFNRIIASVDYARTIPLFYSLENDKLIISDKADDVLSHISKIQPDIDSWFEFPHSGFVTGPDTLIKGLQQLQAGEALTFLDGKISLKRYFHYLSNVTTQTEARAEDYFHCLDSAYVNAFVRLLQSIGSRTIVIPLSGGLDSRLIAVMLNRLGKSDVICFAYGAKNTADVNTSRRVAKILGYRWIHVPYTFRKWRSWANSELYHQYLNTAHNFSSTPHIDDWLAIGLLQNEKIIPDDSVFVPGHTGDFISGGHIPHWFQGKETVPWSKFSESIVGKHYRLWPPLLERWGYQSYARIVSRIKSRLTFPEEMCIEDKLTASRHESFDWQERQAKYIINSVQVFEFWGYSWRLPFWDIEIIEAWRNIPIDLKIGKFLYEKWLHRISNLFPLPETLTKKVTNNFSHSMMYQRIIKPYRNYLSDKIGPIAKPHIDYFASPLRYYSQFSYPVVSWKNGYIQNIVSLLSVVMILSLY